MNNQRPGKFQKSEDYSSHEILLDNFILHM